jgi:hypothetical protein
LRADAPRDPRRVGPGALRRGLNATRDLVLPTTITGSYPRPAWFKCVAIALGANLVRRELGLPEAPVPAADPRFT